MNGEWNGYSWARWGIDEKANVAFGKGRPTGNAPMRPQTSQPIDSEIFEFYQLRCFRVKASFVERVKASLLRFTVEDKLSLRKEASPSYRGLLYPPSVHIWAFYFFCGFRVGLRNLTRLFYVQHEATAFCYKITEPDSFNLGFINPVAESNDQRLIAFLTSKLRVVQMLSFLFFR